MTVRRRCVCTSAMRFAQTVGLFVRYGARAFRIAPVRLFGFVRLNIYSGENAHRECKVQRNIAQRSGRSGFRSQRPWWSWGKINHHILSA